MLYFNIIYLILIKEYYTAYHVNEFLAAARAMRALEMTNGMLWSEESNEAGTGSDWENSPCCRDTQAGGMLNDSSDELSLSSILPPSGKYADYQVKILCYLRKRLQNHSQNWVHKTENIRSIVHDRHNQ